ncbi:metallophosphoesterase [Mucilaginibacter sp. PAMB04274]|uniref:metallophosphoesterase family protein n=1 Tax=Mucilaginibacter sp. PAMB04274 TaxID=3138568 RepID=UPI0031F665BC
MKRIAFITDIHLNEELIPNVDAAAQWEKILADVASRNIDELVFGGDIGHFSAYPWFFDTLKNTPPDFKLLIGNHDTYTEAVRHYSNPYLGNHQELYYAYEGEYHRYIVLDSSQGCVSDNQLQWLAGQLQTDKDVVLFIHHPVFSMNTPVDREFPLTNREQVQDILQQSGKTIHIFCGHYHLPDEQQHGRINQSITPAASYQIKKEAQDIQPYADYFAYRIIVVQETKITSELIFLSN